MTRNDTRINLIGPYVLVREQIRHSGTEALHSIRHTSVNCHLFSCLSHSLDMHYAILLEGFSESILQTVTHFWFDDGLQK